MVDFLCFCSVDPLTSPEKRLDDLMRLGELCIEVLQQNEEHHSEVWLVLLFWWNTHTIQTNYTESHTHNFVLLAL